MSVFAMIMTSVIFFGSLILIFSEKINRSIIAISGAVLMIVLGKVMGFYSEEAAIEAIDFNTLGLLMGMMILVAMLEPTGFFQYLAVLAARASQGKPLRLFVLLGSITTVLSMLLDNVTTVVLIAPVTILISEILGVSAVPYLVAEAILSNTGGAATLVGDPPNVLIGSAAGLSFTDFLVNSLPIILVSWAAALFLLQYLFKAELSKRPKRAKAVMKLNVAETLNQPETAKKILIVLVGAILLFFVHHILNTEPSLVALGAAAVALLWVQPDLQDILKRVEWSVLVFFGSLFIMVGGLEHSGVLGVVVKQFSAVSDISPILFGIIMIWIVAALSAVVDNVPITIALIPVIKGLGELGMNMNPLWWALVFGAGFGGNGTIIGATANIIVASLSEKTREPITAALWIKRGLPVMVLTCAIASILYAIMYPWF
ncbi:MAG: ArsB/NhaD family transporter [Anaerolineales bacterium]|nr:ArsB/NhaD family transporter [Anaerolineales bacterium]MCB9146839.1 ArsB/NhaD family transporter [Anaerolineales bacterium]